MNKIIAFLPVISSALLLLGGCTTSPTSGQSIFTGFVSPQQEAQIGADSRTEIMKEFNGESDNQAMNALVQKIGAKLVPHAERKEVIFSFTVLNDDIVNAFAVPGGHIFITRGLINLAQSESEVAAVLAHEMGHINARHSAQQMSQSMIANLGLQVLGVATDSTAALQASSVGADLFMKKYSRNHELEADALAVRYLAAAGYDPFANAKFLQRLADYTALQQRMAGSAAGNELGSFFATHPPTQERVNRATALAGQTPPVQNPVTNRETYLRAVDGTVYGDSAEQGFVRGRQFIHPVLRVKFEVPQGFRIQNTPKQVIATDASGATILFDMGEGRIDDAVDYITTSWAPNAATGNQEVIEVNGMPGATASTRMLVNGRQQEGQLVAISAGNNKFYRLVFLAPAGGMSRYATEFRRTTYSLSKLTNRDVELASPNRVRLIKVKQGDTIQSLAAQMPVPDFAVERFCLLNGLQPGDRLTPGDTLKTVATF